MLRWYDERCPPMGLAVLEEEAALVRRVGACIVAREQGSGGCTCSPRGDGSRESAALEGKSGRGCVLD